MKKNILQSCFFVFLFLFSPFPGSVFAETPEQLNNQAINKYKEGKIEEALEDMNRAVLLSPTMAVFYNNRGVIKLKSRDEFGALADYNKTIELKPDARTLALAYFNRGKLKLKRNKIEAAIRDFDRAVFLNPRFAPLYKARAKAKWKSAEADFILYRKKK
jgi:Flp pilus assembly protein TadD